VSGPRQYRLVRELASGSFGTVYLAEMNAAGGFKKQVALKVLHEGWSNTSEAALRFRDEARLLGQIRHRHVVQVDGLFEVNGRWAVVMEYVPGADASAVVKACRRARENIPVLAALEVTSAVASALEAAWNAQSETGEALRVIHRDIKPSNIRLTPDGGVKVLDFGIAHAQFAQREAETEAVRFGTLRYMAPERRWGKPDTPAGDVYSLGCVLYEMLAGGPLGNAEPVPEQHAARVDERLAHVRERLTPEEADALLDLVRRMVAWEPERRPTAPDIGVAARALCRGRTDEDLAAFSRRFVPMVAHYLPEEGGEVLQGPGSTGGVDSSGSPTSSPPQQPARSNAPKPWMTAGAGAVGGAAVVGAALFTWSKLAEPAAARLEISVPGAESVELACGAAMARGIDAAAVSNGANTSCTVRAVVSGRRYESTIVGAESPRRLVCRTAGEDLRCP
jgi:serine/threonine protein kinase